MCRYWKQHWHKLIKSALTVDSHSKRVVCAAQPIDGRALKTPVAIQVVRIEAENDVGIVSVKTAVAVNHNRALLFEVARH